MDYHIAQRDVFGGVRASTGSSENPWLFPDEQHDADSGLYYCYAQARFLPPIPGVP